MKDYLQSNKKILTVLTALTVVILSALIIVSCKYFGMSNSAVNSESGTGIEADGKESIQHTETENRTEAVEETGTDAESERAEEEQIKSETLERWEYLRDTVRNAVENPRVENAE